MLPVLADVLGPLFGPLRLFGSTLFLIVVGTAAVHDLQQEADGEPLVGIQRIGQRGGLTIEGQRGPTAVEVVLPAQPAQLHAGEASHRPMHDQPAPETCPRPRAATSSSCRRCR